MEFQITLEVNGVSVSLESKTLIVNVHKLINKSSLFQLRVIISWVVFSSKEKLRLRSKRIY